MTSFAKANPNSASRQAWRADNSDLVEWLNGQNFDRAHPFIRAMIDGLGEWGSLTDGQANAARKWMARDQQRQAERAEQNAGLPELAEGRRLLRGHVISTKEVYSEFGGTYRHPGSYILKMLVELEDGNRVYGTAANGLEVEKGSAVEFTASVEVSRDDQHFGFFKRPHVKLAPVAA